MISVSLTKSEYYIISYHLNVFREAVKKGYKSNSFFRWRRKMKVYDTTLELFNTENVFNSITLNFSNDQFKVLKQFLNWYCDELEADPSNTNNTEVQEFKELTKKVGNIES